MRRLKKLDANDLSIAATASLPRPPGRPDPFGRMPGGDFHPYDHSTTADGNVARDTYNCGGRGTLKPERALPARKPVASRKLREWREPRKRVEQNEREEGHD